MIITNTGKTILFDLSYDVGHSKLYTKEWYQAADNSWHTYDLGIETDKRSCVMSVEGRNSDIIDLQEYFLDLTMFGGGAEVLHLQLGDGEELFGVELDYTNPIDVYLAEEPLYEYVSLDWARLNLRFIIDPLFTPTFKTSQPINSLSDVPWDMAVKRTNDQNRVTILPYTGKLTIVYDDAFSQNVKASFLLTREEAIAMKLYLMQNRINTISIPSNTYFNLTGISEDKYHDVFFKVKDYKESREEVGMYKIELEMLING